MKITEQEFDILDNYKYCVVDNDEKINIFWNIVSLILFGLYLIPTLLSISNIFSRNITIVIIE